MKTSPSPRLAHGGESAPEPGRQLSLFAGQDQAVLEELKRADIDHLTPLDALAMLAELQRRLRET